MILWSSTFLYFYINKNILYLLLFIIIISLFISDVITQNILTFMHFACLVFFPFNQLKLNYNQFCAISHYINKQYLLFLNCTG